MTDARRGDPPLRVFLSYTGELRAFPTGRSFVNAAADAVRNAGHVPVDMTNWHARHLPAVQVCREQVAKCDVLVTIAGFCYGSPVHGEEHLSYVELEYDAGARLERLVFLLAENLAENISVPADLIDTEFGDRQKVFRARLRKSGVCADFSTPEELDRKLLQVLVGLKGEHGKVSRSAWRRNGVVLVVAIIAVVLAAIGVAGLLIAALDPLPPAGSIEKRLFSAVIPDVVQTTDASNPQRKGTLSLTLEISDSDSSATTYNYCAPRVTPVVSLTTAEGKTVSSPLLPLKGGSTFSGSVPIPGRSSRFEVGVGYPAPPTGADCAIDVKIVESTFD